jgi:hypothetical protein
LTSYNVPAETLLSINFTLINAAASDSKNKIKEIDLSGEVRYSRPAPRKEYRLGIRFTSISKEDAQALSEFVSAIKG